jgi:hypothetical protein
VALQVTREERKLYRIERLLNRLEAAGVAWAAAENNDGIETGRLGIVAADTQKQREKAEATFRSLVERLREAVRTPAR